jgi:hypothetical protein
MAMKPIYLWTIAIAAAIVAGLLSVAAYASIHGGLELVAMTYGAMALLVVTILIVQSFIVPREKAFTQPWLVTYLISTPIALVFMFTVVQRALSCIWYDPAYLFSTVLAFCIFTLLSPLFIFPAPLKLRLPAAVIAIVVLLVPGFRLSDPFGPRHEVLRPSNFMGYFLAGPKSDARVIVRTMRESGATPGRYDHVWYSHGDDGVLSRNFGPTDYDPVVELVDEDELLGQFVLEENGAWFIRFNSRLEEIDPVPTEVSGEGFVKSWQLTNVQRDYQADIKDGGSFVGFVDLVARNIQDDKVVVFEGFEYRQIAMWRDESTVLAVRRFITEDSKLVNVPSENPDEFGEWISTPGKSIIQLVELNLIDAEITLVRSVELDDIPSIVAPLDDVGLMMTGSNHDDRPLLYLDWESGEVSTLLSGIDTGSLAVLTVDDTIRFACQQTLPDESKRVAMGTHEGVSATLPIDEGKSAMFACPSPDGEKAFIAIKEAPWGQTPLDEFVVYGVWDLPSNMFTRLIGHGSMAAFYNPEMNFLYRLSQIDGTTHSPWSSDSRKLAFLFCEPTGFDFAHRFRLHIVHLGR